MLGHDCLSERQQQILWATVHRYVATAEPVGSKVLAAEYDLQVSSATIRNTMGRLEKVGLLYQPHTSAGRIPSDSGYRVYVDHLITPDDGKGEQLRQVYTQQLDWGRYNLEQLLQRSAQILATLSGYIALITLPQTTGHRIQSLHILPISPEQGMLVVVTDAYETQSMRLDLSALMASDRPEDTALDMSGELQILSNFLNQKLRGQSLAALQQLNWQELGEEFRAYSAVIQQILGEVVQRYQTPMVMPIVIRGIAEALRQPEFSEVQQVQTLLYLLEEEQEQLFPLIFKQPEQPEQRSTVRIGAENPLAPLSSCTVISAQYYKGNLPVGSVGLIGPTRMLYENAIALVESTAQYLSDTLNTPS